MIVIDWFSPPNHKNFCKAFFSALSEIFISEYIVFDEKLIMQDVKTNFIKAPDSRLGRAIFMFSIVFKLRKEKILLLTYDPLYLPLLLFFKSDLIVYEHNTTPEIKNYFKSIWQFFLFRRVLRLAQFLGQYRRLLDLKQKVVYLGSPLNAINSKVQIDKNRKDIFIIPSRRGVFANLGKYSSILKGEKVLAKGNINAPEYSLNDIELEFRDRVELEYDNLPIKGILISIDSYIRGTGWFNEAISNQIPLLTMNKESKTMFEETFPGFPFIHLEEIKGKDDLYEKLYQMNNYKELKSYILRHNKSFQERFPQELKSSK